MLADLYKNRRDLDLWIGDFLRAVWATVVKGDGVLDGLQMRGDLDLGEGLLDVGLNTFHQVMAIVYGPGPGHQDVQFGEPMDNHAYRVSEKRSIVP
jgi:hypothetical protein